MVVPSSAAHRTLLYAFEMSNHQVDFGSSNMFKINSPIINSSEPLRHYEYAYAHEGTYLTQIVLLVCLITVNVLSSWVASLVVHTEVTTQKFDFEFSVNICLQFYIMSV